MKLTKPANPSHKNVTEGFYTTWSLRSTCKLPYIVRTFSVSTEFDCATSFSETALSLGNSGCLSRRGVQLENNRCKELLFTYFSLLASQLT